MDDVDFDLGALAGTHVAHLRLFEVRDDVGLERHDLQQRHALRHQRSGMNGELRCDAVGGGGHARVRQIELRGLHSRLCRLNFRM